MKNNRQHTQFNTRKTSVAGHSGQVLARVVDMVTSFFKSGKKRNKIRTSSPVSTYQNIWRLKRLARSLVFFSIVAAVMTSMGWFSFLLLRNSDVFQVTSVNVLGNSAVPKKNILASAGLNRGINLLEIDIDQVESSVRSLPWIEHVTVSRHWPSSVEVAVKEHKPLALFNHQENGKSTLYYMDSKGHVFAPLTEAQDMDFPVLTGTILTENLLDMKVQAGSLSRLGLEIMNLAAKGNQILPLQAISEVHIDEEKGVILYLVDHPFPIYMGKEKIRSRFSLLVRLLAQLYRQDKVKEVAEIHMDYAEDRIMVAGIGAS